MNKYQKIIDKITRDDINDFYVRRNLESIRCSNEYRYVRKFNRKLFKKDNIMMIRQYKNTMNGGV